MRLATDLGASLATALAGALYLAVIASQGEPIGAVTWIVCISVAAASGTALGGHFARRRLRTALFSFTAIVDVVWLLLGALSIGVAFAPGVILAFAAAQRRD